MTPIQPQPRASQPLVGLCGPGFANATFDAQVTFRAVMTAMAEPGTIQPAKTSVGQCPGFSPAMSALALTLVDFETRVWLDSGVKSETAAYVRFQTGAPIVSAPVEATFAFITRPREMARFSSFAQGTLDYPDTSTTVIIEVTNLDANSGFRLRGPGIPGERRLLADPLPETFVADFAANRAAFPCGIDIVLCCGTRIAALPRSTHLARADRG